VVSIRANNTDESQIIVLEGDTPRWNLLSLDISLVSFPSSSNRFLHQNLSLHVSISRLCWRIDRGRSREMKSQRRRLGRNLGERRFDFEMMVGR